MPQSIQYYQLCSNVHTAIAEYAEKYKHILTPDEGAPYDQLIEINLDEVCSHVSCVCLCHMCVYVCACKHAGLLVALCMCHRVLN